MADEIRVKAKIEWDPANSNTESVNTGLFDATIDQSGADYGSFTQEIGTSEENLDIPTDVGTAGYMLIKNLDSTNYVELGLTGSYTIKLKAGEVALFRANGTMTAKANTAACNIQAYVFED